MIEFQVAKDTSHDNATSQDPIIKLQEQPAPKGEPTPRPERQQPPEPRPTPTNPPKERPDVVPQQEPEDL